MTLTLKIGPNSFAWHTSSGLCTAISGLDTKGWAVQRISSGQSLEDIYTKRRTRRFQYTTPRLPQHFYVGYNETYKRFKTKLHMLQKYYETTKRQEKCCKSLVNIRWLCWFFLIFFLQDFDGHVEYLRIPDKVSIFYLGRPQKWIQHIQFLWKTFSDSSISKMPQGVWFFGIALLYSTILSLFSSLGQAHRAHVACDSTRVTGCILL